MGEVTFHKIFVSSSSFVYSFIQYLVILNNKIFVIWIHAEYLFILYLFVIMFSYILIIYNYMIKWFIFLCIIMDSGLFIHILFYDPNVFIWLLTVFQPWPLKLFHLDPGTIWYLLVIEGCFCLFVCLSTFLLSAAEKNSGLNLCISCPIFRISHISK